MSRKDFILIAETIKDADVTQGSRVQLAHDFAYRLAQTSPQFNRDLFIQAATGIVPVNARKARV